MTQTKENSIEILRKAVIIGQSKGCFSLADASVLCDAVDFFDEKVKTKSSKIETEKDAVKILANGVGVAQLKGSYSLKDAKELFTAIQFLE